MGKIIFNKAALAGKEADELQSKIELLTKDISIKHSAISTLEKSASRVRDKLTGLKNLMEQGLVYQRDRKSVEVEIRNLSVELVELEKRQKEATQTLEKAESELQALRKEFSDKYVVVEIAEPVKREPQYFDAMAVNVVKS